MDTLHNILKKTQEKISTDTYCICFIDLLKQSEILNNFPDEPFAQISEKNQKDAENVTTKIKYIRESLKELATYIKDPPDQLKQSLKDKDQNFNENIYRENFSNFKIGVQQFSDTIMTYVQIPDIKDEGRSNIIIIISAWLSKLSYIMLTYLSLETPIRGVLTIGNGWEINENNFYGKAILKAYNLESKEVKYPRIIVDKIILQWLEAVRTKSKLDHEKLFTGKVFKDIDDKYTIDFLRNCEEYEEYKKDAYNFICKEVDKFTEEKNLKLLEKYEYLKNYFKKLQRRKRNPKILKK